MRIYELGEGTPDVAVVGSLHGDEPCGARAIERLVAADPVVERPVKLIIANEVALDRGVRYVEEDLNRAFPGDPNASTHERRLAHELARELRGCTSLALHSTQSHPEPFAIIDHLDAVSRSVCPHLPVDAVVQTGEQTEGRLIAHPHTIEVECGLQGSASAVENATELVRAFLVATDVLPVETRVTTDGGDVPVFRLLDPIPKPPAETYEVFVDNFARVREGERFAAADGESFHAEREFYPILLSAYGYRSQFGYAGERVDALD